MICNANIAALLCYVCDSVEGSFMLIACILKRTLFQPSRHRISEHLHEYKWKSGPKELTTSHAVGSLQNLKFHYLFTLVCTSLALILTFILVSSMDIKLEASVPRCVTEMCDTLKIIYSN